MTAAAVQVPIGVEDELRGVVDLVRWKAIYNEGVKGYVDPPDCCFSQLTDLAVTRSSNRMRSQQKSSILPRRSVVNSLNN